jgi:hypothetical protein
MEYTTDSETTIDGSHEQNDADFYLPGTASLSTDPGPVEQFITTLFRERGDLHAVVRSDR